MATNYQMIGGGLQLESLVGAEAQASLTVLYIHTKITRERGKF